MTQNAVFAVMAAFGLSACAAPGVMVKAPDVARPIEPKRLTEQDSPSPSTDSGACYGVDESPAQVETVTEYYSAPTPLPNSIMLEPAVIAPDGTMLLPPVYKTRREEIRKEREVLWLETPCADDWPPDIIASLQRALEVRGHYGGPVNGRLTGATRRAIRSYQRSLGLDSAILSIEAARQLGLVAY